MDENPKELKKKVHVQVHVYHIQNTCMNELMVLKTKAAMI